MAWRNRPDFDPSKYDRDDPSTWAVRDEDCCEAEDIVLSDQACARIAGILDRARGQRAREKLRGSGGTT